MKTRVLGIALTSGLLLAAEANAAPIYLDFTSGAWSAVEGQTETTLNQGSLGVTLSASGGLLTFNEDDSPGAFTDTMALLGDGIGVGDDEIGWGQSLTVSFSSVVSLLSFDLLDLYPGEGIDGAPEQFLVDYGIGGTATGSAGATNGAGYYGSGLIGLSVDSITFSAFGGDWSDFALAGLWIDDGIESALAIEAANQVPEPGPLSLLGAGLLLLGIRRIIPRSRAARLAA